MLQIADQFIQPLALSLETLGISKLMVQHNTPRDRVEHGLNTIPADRTVTVSLRDLMFVHQTLAEFNRFFHQRMHYPDVAAVHRFLGSYNAPGAYDVLSEAYYHRMRDMIPTDMEEAFAEGTRFEHPLTPAYYAGSVPEPPESA